MKNIKKLLCVLMALAMMASFAFTAFAEETTAPAETEAPAASEVPAETLAKPEVDTENNEEVIDMTHLDVKADAKYYAEIDGETVVLDATVVPETIVVTVTGNAANYVYNFANYNVYTISEDGMTEYRIVLDGTDGAMLNAIDWDGASFYMNNVYVSARLVLTDAPEVLANELSKTEDGACYVDVSFRYTGIQECTGHNGLRSEGNHGIIAGVDLYLSNVPGMSVETPVPETTVPETTVPETTVPETTVPETTEPAPTETEPKPETDDVPATGDEGMTMMVAVLCISVVGMVATAIIGKKLQYVGKWQ